MDELLVNLTSEQQKIIDWGESSRVLNVTAKAGSGKSTTAAELLARRIGQGNRVLALTFTRNGARELVELMAQKEGFRFSSSGGAFYKSANGLVISTFDSFLRPELVKVGVSEALWATIGWISVVESVVEQGGAILCKEHPETFDRVHLRSQIWDLCGLLERHVRLDPSIEKSLRPIWDEVAREAHRKKRLMIGEYQQLVKANAVGIAKQCREAFQYVVVDESQDTSEHELEVLVALSGSIPMVLLGDPGQNLMAFRGALGDLGVFFRDRGVPCEAGSLSENRRSTQKLVVGQNSLQSGNGWTGALARGGNGVVGKEPVTLGGVTETQLLDALSYVLGCFLRGGSRSENHGVSGNVQGLLRERVGLLTEVGAMDENRRPSVEILVPTNDAGSSLVSALWHRGFNVPFLEAKVNPFETPLAMLLKSWCNPDGEHMWMRIGLVMESQFRLARGSAHGRAREELDAIQGALMDWCLRHPGSGASFVSSLEEARGVISGISCDPNVSTELAHRCLKRVSAVLEKWQKVYLKSDLGAMLDWLIYATNSVPGSSRRDRSRKGPQSSEPWLFQRVREAGVTVSGVSDLLEFWSQQATRRPSSGLPHGFPCIKTINGAKGDTVDVSILFHAEKIPFRPRAGGLEMSSDTARRQSDDLALAYVAASRARYVHLEFVLQRLGEYHRRPLPGWIYSRLDR